ncbi:hypothetical protein [Burkholderia pseudomultivorans]|uniref:hypothetical protein n=1 Tax=Burkholderia pseudomultivorans TaxID=1207504 RepID=UPI0012D85577|nr:hypothetical protein [Burkholderia pseudomultivorans]
MFAIEWPFASTIAGSNVALVPMFTLPPRWAGSEPRASSVPSMSTPLLPYRSISPPALPDASIMPSMLTLPFAVSEARPAPPSAVSDTACAVSVLPADNVRLPVFV